MVLDEGGAPLVLAPDARTIRGDAVPLRVPVEAVTRAALFFLPVALATTLLFYAAYSWLAAGTSLARVMLVVWVAVVALLAAAAALATYQAMRRESAESEVSFLRDTLARERASLEATNRQLDLFSHAVSHEVRSPLRGIDGFSKTLLEDHSGSLDEDARAALSRVRAAAQRMGELIDDLVTLSRVVRDELSLEPRIDLSAIAQKVARDLQRSDPDRRAEFVIAPGVTATADRRLLRLALENLLGNAWKFTARRDASVIEFGLVRRGGADAYFVRDNGAGFDMAYAGHLFGAFRRLHTADEFPGRGIGLAMVQRIVSKHGGEIWGEAESGKGATFYFTLGKGAVA